MKRGQSFLENVIVTGMVISSVMILFYFSSDFTFFHYRQQEADDALRSLLITANAVHELGPGNKEEVLVNIPEDIKLDVSKRELFAYDSSGDINASVRTTFDIIGTIQPGEGISKVSVRAVNQTLVKIGKWPFILSLQPQQVDFTLLPVIVYIYGEDLDLSTRLVVNGIAYGPVPAYTVINSTLAHFTAQPAIFPAPGPLTAYRIAVTNTTSRISSNVVSFYVRP